MRPPPKIPANPSFVELDEDENAVEKFKKAMANISSILSLDRLKQVCHSLCVYVSFISYHRSLRTSVYVSSYKAASVLTSSTCLS